jgi:pimeloyl-ACP methyl ester carboxylesterase
MIDSTIVLTSGRTIGYALFGGGDGPPVLWCHSGPGSRLSPAYVAGTAAGSAYRFIGIDRPGYGRSDPLPGRTITDWVGDALAVADHPGIDRFATVGTSTGGQYGLALAACAPGRVSGVVAACSMTDMRYAPARATMSYPHAIAVWNAPDRDHAMTAAPGSSKPSRMPARARRSPGGNGKCSSRCPEHLCPSPSCWSRWRRSAVDGARRRRGSSQCRQRSLARPELRHLTGLLADLIDGLDRASRPSS